MRNGLGYMRYGFNWFIDVILACKVNVKDIMEKVMVLVREEAPCSWDWWTSWHNPTWNVNGNLVTDVDPRDWMHDYYDLVVWIYLVWVSAYFLGVSRWNFKVVLQWSGRNSMAPDSGCPWLCLGVSKRANQARLDPARFGPVLNGPGRAGP